LEKFQNGIITYAHWLKLELERQGHRVSIFTAHAAGPDTSPAVHVPQRTLRDRIRDRFARLRNPGLSFFDTYAALIAASILKVHRRDPIDVIEMEESFGWCADIQRLTGIPTVVKLHGPAFLSFVGDELDSAAARDRIRREGEALAQSAFIVSPSRDTLDRTLEYYALKPLHSGVIFNPLSMGADTPGWKLPACSQETILFVGRFDQRKGADVVLQAFRSLLDERPHLKLVFVGPDSGWKNQDGTQVLQASYAAELFPGPLQSQVQFKGRMPNHEITRLRTEAMTTVVASRWENQSYALLEAMYQGCPVVCTDAGGCPESITHGATGLLAQSGDPADFAAKIRSVLDNPARAEAMGQAAREYATTQHSVTTIAAQALELYSQAIDHHRRAGGRQ